MKETFIGHRIQLFNSDKTGITLGFNSLSSENMIEKYLVSFDGETITERLTEDNLHFREKVSEIDFFKRLIRDIQASDEKTREFASEILCDFIEFKIEDFDLDILKLGIEKIIEQLITENNANAEQKLAEALFEFIWQDKISVDQKIELLEILTEINSYSIWSYLGTELEEDIEKYNSQKLKKYYSENIQKWKERDEWIYGKEK